MKLSAEVRAIPSRICTGMQIQYHLAWVRTYLKKSGLAENTERGVWSLTEIGKTIPISKLPLIPGIVQKTTIVELPETPPDQGSNWQEVALQTVACMNYKAFERLCQRILQGKHFEQVVVTGRSGDGGIDGTCVLRINLISSTVVFQCKCWKARVGPEVVRDFRGAMVGRKRRGLL